MVVGQIEGRRPRGRPLGSGKKDHQDLVRMATLIVADPKLKPSTAAKSIFPGITDSHLRRLQVKWKEAGPDLLHAVRRDIAHRREQLATSAPAKVALGYPLPPHVVSSVLKFADSPVMRQMHELNEKIRAVTDTPMMRAMTQIADSPMMKTMRQIADTPMMRTMSQIADTPMMKTMRQITENDPFTKIAKQMASFSPPAWMTVPESPTMKSIRELSERMEKLNWPRSSGATFEHGRGWPFEP